MRKVSPTTTSSLENNFRRVTRSGAFIDLARKHLVRETANSTFDFRLLIWELEPRQIPPSHIWHLRVPCAAVLGSVIQEVWPLREGPMAYEEVGSRNTIGSVSIGL
ncbi:hypothetical protein TNCV_4042991 [Trichonephila clavipes]|nr:hypothetical protein TNCV_4042991 [Trichonephila clavipes]